MSFFSKILSWFKGEKTSETATPSSSHPQAQKSPHSNSGSVSFGGSRNNRAKESGKKSPNTAKGSPKLRHDAPQGEGFSTSSNVSGQKSKRVKFDKPAQPVRQEEFAPIDDKFFGNGIADKKPLGDWQPPVPIQDDSGNTYFQNFALRPEILRALLDDLKFTKCTPIQGMALPHILNGEDVAGKAQTGTGKTAVFLMAILQKYLTTEHHRKLNQPFAFIMAPTRELVIQIAKDANAMSPYTPMRTVAVYGGMDYDRQRRLLQAGCDLIVATPGRLIDYLKQGVLDTSQIQIAVIDEADRMLDMGFIPDVRRIMYMMPTPQDRQTLLFSATLSHDILNLARQWMRQDPAVVEIEPEQVVAKGVNETVYACTSKEKLAIMLWIINHEDCHRILIFRNRRRDVEDLHERLLRYGVKSESLSGDVDQKKRVRILEDFRTGKITTIVATDVAARGIHVDDVTHVFNYDLPYEAEDYVHRVGRTARAGHKGRAISFAGEDCAFVIPEIETYIGRPLPITQPEDEMLLLPPEADKYEKPSQGKNGVDAVHRPHHSGIRPRSSGHSPKHS